MTFGYLSILDGNLDILYYNSLPTLPHREDRALRTCPAGKFRCQTAGVDFPLEGNRKGVKIK
jgi:hypothetical protein